MQTRKEALEDIFLNKSNVLHITKKIYVLHKDSTNNPMPYLFFKKIVPIKMSEWLFAKERPLNQAVLNEFFIRENKSLYQTAEKNVFRSEAILAHNGSKFKKQYKDFTPDDIRNVDVWEEQTISYKVNPKIRVWDKAFMSRPYDRSNEGFVNTAENASLKAPTYGYEEEMNILAEMKKKKINNYYSKNYTYS